MRKFFLVARVLILLSAFITLSAARAEDDTLAIGFTVSQTGALNLDSLAQVHGFEMWRDDVNAEGGIKAGNKRYKVRFITYDDQSQGMRVQQLYTRLIQVDKAQFLFSPYTAGLVATAAVVSEQYGKLMICVGSSEPQTFKLGNKYLYQMYTPSNFYARHALAVVKSKAPRAKVALVFLDNPFPKTVAAAAREEAKANGMEIVLDESYAPGQTDFSSIITKLISSRADVLLGGGFYPDSSTLARQLYDQKAGLKWISLLVAPDSGQFASIGPGAMGISVPSQWAPSIPYKPDAGPTPADFAKRYEAKFQTMPGYHAAAAYAAGLVLQRAIEKVGSIDPKPVAAELDKTDTTTLFGHTKFSNDPKSHGLQVGHELVLLQWQMKNAKLAKEVVWPAGISTASAQYPMR